MHFCTIELMMILSAIPVLKYFVQPCCRRILEKLKKHHDQEKQKK